jgi:hypothetical protein
MTNVSFYFAMWPDSTATIVMTDNKRGHDLWSCLDEIGDPSYAKVFLMQSDGYLDNPLTVELVPVDPVGPWQKPRRKRPKKIE